MNRLNRFPNSNNNKPITVGKLNQNNNINSNIGLTQKQDNKSQVEDKNIPVTPIK